MLLLKYYWRTLSHSTSSYHRRLIYQANHHTHERPLDELTAADSRASIPLMFMVA